MYEKHIEDLEAIRNALRGGRVESLDAAIALMRAAEPKDEAVEREHCRKALLEQNRAWLFDATMNQEQRNAVTEWLMRERAAARAEVEAKYVAELNEYKECRRSLLDQLAEARAALKTASD